MRSVSQGEWGKILGLDRIPEVQTMRRKLEELAADTGKVQQWSSTLAGEWMQDEPGVAGTWACFEKTDREKGVII